MQDIDSSHRLLAVRDKLREIVTLNNTPKIPGFNILRYLLWGHLHRKVHSIPMENINKFNNNFASQVKLLKLNRVNRQ